MITYVVCTMKKDTKELNYKYIEAESLKSVAIEEYIDSMGDVIWGTYESSYPLNAIIIDFARFAHHYFKNNK